MVDLFAIRSHDGGEPRLVHQVQCQAQRIVGGVLVMQATHRPDLDHCRRRDEGGVACGVRGCLVNVDGIGIADRLDPVVDHRQVHRVSRGEWLRSASRLYLLDGTENVIWGHSGSLSADVAARIVFTQLLG